MSSRTERCRHCRAGLLVPPGTGGGGSIRCSVCWTVNTVRPPHHTRGRLHERVRWTKNWVKGLVEPVRCQVTSFVASATSLRPPSPLPASFPRVHGSKRALLVGITYRSMRYELKGSVNDVNCMKYLLQTRLGFSEECILVLTEEERDPYRIPTRQNMTAAMRWLLDGCRPGNSLFFHFSGHGSQRIDTSSDEDDGYDETLCPLDYETSGMITDDEIHSTIVEPLPRGVVLHAVVDACHSGSSLDLPYVCKMDRTGHWQWQDIRNNKKTSGGLAICFSGCADDQTSSDTSAFARDVSTGALTYCFIKSLETEPGITYGHMLQGMRIAIREANTFTRIDGPIASLLRKVFQTGLTQVPQLSSSEQFDIFRKPVQI